jgi:hypothetical protein
MRNSLLTLTIVFISLACSITAAADVKVRSKQTMSGQSYESTTYIKGKRQRSETLGGMVHITQCDLRRGLQLNTNSRTYIVNPFDQTAQTAAKPGTAVTDENGVVQTGGRVTTTVTIKDTGERKQMFGYTARHLIITMETVSSPDACNKSKMKMQTDGWYIDAAFALDCDGGALYQNYNPHKKTGGCQDKYDVKTVGTAKRGYPVYERMTMFDESGKESYSMISEVMEFSQATLEASLFDVPEGFREVADATQMYRAAAAYDRVSSDTSASTVAPTQTGVSSSIKNAANSPGSSAGLLGPKKAGILRIGISSVKTGSVGEGITAADLSAAVQNTFIKYLKVPNVEVVTLNAKLDTDIDSEAKSKECDYVIYANASHKKGGGGFGIFKALAPMLSSVAGYGSTSGTSTVSGSIKNKDEITLDVKLNKTGGTPALAKVYKTKAKSDGDDIISQLVEQASLAIVSAVAQG